MGLQDLINSYTQPQQQQPVQQPVGQQEQAPVQPEAAPSEFVAEQSSEQAPATATETMAQEPVAPPTNTDSKAPVPAADQIAEGMSTPDAQGLADADRATLNKLGYSDEQIAQFTAPYDPSSNEGYLSRFYKENVPAPVNRASDKQLMWSQIGDTMGLLAELYGTSKGADVKARRASDFYLPAAVKQKRADEITYQKELQDYYNTIAKARQEDVKQGYDMYKTGRKDLYAALRNSKLDALKKEIADQNVAIKKAQMDSLNAYRDKKLASDEEYRSKTLAQKDRQLASTERFRNASQAIAKQRLEVYKNNAGGGGSTGAKAGKFNGLVIEANDADQSADIFVDDNGNRLIKVPMTGAQIEVYARKAKADPEWLAEHPEMITSWTNDPLEPKPKGYAKNSELAAAYYQSEYNSRYPDPDAEAKADLLNNPQYFDVPEVTQKPAEPSWMDKVSSALNSAGETVKGWLSDGSSTDTAAPDTADDFSEFEIDDEALDGADL